MSYSRNPAIYIMTNEPNGILYTGVTSNLIQRIYQHKGEHHCGFTRRYRCKLLVYYEIHDNMENAIGREKQIKAGSRKKKVELIVHMNPQWDDLYPTLL